MAHVKEDPLLAVLEMKEAGLSALRREDPCKLRELIRQAAASVLGSEKANAILAQPVRELAINVTHKIPREIAELIVTMDAPRVWVAPNRLDAYFNNLQQFHEQAKRWYAGIHGFPN